MMLQPLTPIWVWRCSESCSVFFELSYWAGMMSRSENIWRCYLSLLDRLWGNHNLSEAKRSKQICANQRTEYPPFCQAIQCNFQIWVACDVKWNHVFAAIPILYLLIIYIYLLFVDTCIFWTSASCKLGTLTGRIRTDFNSGVGLANFVRHVIAMSYFTTQVAVRCRKVVKMFESPGICPLSFIFKKIHLLNSLSWSNNS